MGKAVGLRCGAFVLTTMIILPLLIFRSQAFAKDPRVSIDTEVYASLFPNYVKYCGMTKVRALNSSGGGPFGHAANFLSAACLDEKYSYPQLRRCTSSDKVWGASASANQVFSNVNWIGMSGLDNFYFAGVKPNETLTPELRLKIVKDFARQGYGRNIKIKPKWLSKKPSEFTMEEYAIDQAIDTDFGAALGRGLRCLNVPITDSLLDRAIEYYNLLNMQYADHERAKNYQLQFLTERDLQILNIRRDKADLEYNWNGTVNNCAHASYNMFAVFGIVPVRSIEKTGIEVIENLSSPNDRLIDLLDLRLGVPSRLGATLASWLKEPAQKTGLIHGFLMQQQGVMLEQVEFHKLNKVYAKPPMMKYANIFNWGWYHAYGKWHSSLTQIRPNIEWSQKWYAQQMELVDKELASKKFRMIGKKSGHSENEKYYSELFQYRNLLLELYNKSRVNLEFLGNLQN